MRNPGPAVEEKPVITGDPCKDHPQEVDPQVITEQNFNLVLKGNIRTRFDSEKPELYCPDGFSKDFQKLKEYIINHPDKKLHIIGKSAREERDKNSGLEGNLGRQRAQKLKDMLVSEYGYRPDQIIIGDQKIDSVDLNKFIGKIYNAYSIRFTEDIKAGDPKEMALLGMIQEIYFDENHNTLIVTDSLRNYLYDLTNLSKNRTDLVLQIMGNTNTNGSAEENKRLGLERAQFIEKEIKKFGILINTECISFGEEKPRFSYETEDGMRKNRRVDLKLIKIK